MKRAKLTQVPLSRSAGSADLTDRLLEREKLPKQPAAGTRPGGRKAANTPAQKPAAAKRSRKQTAARSQGSLVSPPAGQRSGSELAAYVPYRTVGPASAPGPALQALVPASLPAEVPAPLRQALSESARAIAALIAAAGDVPARYDLAVRYRLDALAHHLRQVSDFIASRLA